MFFDSLNVYSVEDWTLEDRIQLYESEILPNVRCSEVKEALVTYLTDTVEPVGWKAIWRPTKLSNHGISHKLDYLVEVLDVSRFQLEAQVSVLNSSDSNNGGGDEKNTKKLLLPVNSLTVPIIELYSVHDEASNGQFDKTAEVIEHVRFFYQNIWRPWDADDDDDCVFVDHYLETRMKLYYEMISGVIPNRLVEKIQNILRVAWKNQQMLDNLEKEMQISDSEIDLDEKDVLKCMEIRLNQDELKRDLQYLENPTLRALVIKKDLALNAVPRGRRQGSEVVLHIVTDKLLAGMLRDLPPSTIVEHHSLFTSAVSAAYENDTIWVFPGIYTCDGLGWFDDSILIEGKGSIPDDVVIKVDGNTDIFMNCNAQDMKLSNLTVEVANNYFSALMIHRGCTTLKNCIIKNGQVGIYTNSYSELVLFGCTIVGSELCCINVHSMSSVTIKECNFRNFEYSAIAIQLDGDNISRPVKLFKNNFYGNGKYGIILYSENQDVRDIVISNQSAKVDSMLRKQLTCFENEDNDFQRTDLSTLYLA